MYFVLNKTATTEIYPYVHTLSLHAALPICCGRKRTPCPAVHPSPDRRLPAASRDQAGARQSRQRRPPLQGQGPPPCGCRPYRPSTSNSLPVPPPRRASPVAAPPDRRRAHHNRESDRPGARDGRPYRPEDRKTVVEGKRVSVRVNIGGGGKIK